MGVTVSCAVLLVSAPLPFVTMHRNSAPLSADAADAIAYVALFEFAMSALFFCHR